MTEDAVFVRPFLSTGVSLVGLATRGVMDATPWTVRTSDEAEPAVPKAGCFAAVEAPVGRDTVPDTFVMFQVPDWAAWVRKVPVPTTVALRLAAVAWVEMNEVLPIDPPAWKGLPRVVLIVDRVVLPVVCRAAVDAPVGSETVPETLVMFHVPAWDTDDTEPVSVMTCPITAAPADIVTGWAFVIVG